MKIWFDISNSPHVNMFATMIRELQRHHEVIITCRPLANTIDLLDLHGFSYTVVGKHYGGKLLPKLYGFPIRVLELARFLRGQKIDVAVSQSSFHSPVVSRLLGVRCLYMNDNEHALGNVPAFICASTVLIPEFLATEKVCRQGAAPRKIIRYPGVKEGIYLWDLHRRLVVRDGRRDRPKVYLRPEPWTAQYYKGKRNFMDSLVLGLRDHVDLVVLPRGQNQGVHYQHSRFEGIQVITAALDIADIAPDCDLFIGAGGTMTREMAVLGIPTISVYQDELLDVDRHLLSVGAFVHAPELTASQVLDHIETSTRRPPNPELLHKGRQAYDLIVNVILNGPITPAV